MPGAIGAAKAASLRRWTGALALLAVACGAAPQAGATPLEIAAAPVAFKDDGDPRIGDLDLVNALVLSSGDKRFGGFSGLWVAGDGRRLTAVSDVGERLTATLSRAPDGAIRALHDADLAPIAGPDGKAIGGSKGRRDAEALTVDADGRHYVAFEIDHRIARYAAGPDPLLGRGRIMPLAKVALRMPANGGFEALAALSGGRLLALSERQRDADGYAQGWLFDRDRYGRWRYQIETDFAPVDMALLPDGDVLVLERRFSWLAGLTIRLRRFRQAALAAPGPVVARLIAEFDHSMAIDNFEGLAVAPAPGGGRAVLVHLISDDNFNALQRTLLAVFRYVF